MSSPHETRSIERQRFFDGQRLFADDLQQIEEFNREMRWLHNQSLHQPGIGNGFSVTGRKGDREVGIEPGYAIDDLGREIVLTSSRMVPVPPVADDGVGQPQRYVLTVQYPSDEDLEEFERREGICDTRGAVRLREEPIFCWVPLNPDGSPAQDPADILSGRKLVLADIAVHHCTLAKDISIAQRRNARPPTQPHIACGIQEPDNWEEWILGDDTTTNGWRMFYQIVGGLQAEIHTRSGGFRTVPGYFARIDGRRDLPIPIDEPPTRTIILDGQLSIVEPTAVGFRVQVIVLQFRADDGEPAQLSPEELVKLAERHWRVGWMGVEG
ncbi:MULTISPECIES: hypothetical protein [Nocardia]|uniref:Uncharacterized protein n=1 Tax=Nocardia sputorum TaxID=2984338 RepID=A0ABM8D122_9NOCA|nr:hypothetical protein [Nocardia sputorum]BDU01029.1 hypothetical protein IFM12276_40570 [Nocardia sputorum]